MAEKALGFLLERAYKNGRLFRTVTGGIGKLNGYLDDYAFLAAALIDAFEATAKPAYLDKARELTAVMVEQFWDPQTGGCFFTGRDHEQILQRMKTGEDSAIPSGNAVATMNFLRLPQLPLLPARYRLGRSGEAAVALKKLAPRPGLEPAISRKARPPFGTCQACW